MDDWVSAAERVYAAIREEILSGAHRPGEKLDAAVLAQRHKTSITPIREALNRLVGEDLVESVSHQGFRTPILTSAGLRGLYEWNCQQLLGALRLAPAARLSRLEPERWPTREVFERDEVAATERSFLAIGHLSGIARCLRSIERMNAELKPVRRLERLLIDKENGNLWSIPQALSEHGMEAGAQIITRYHAVRRDAAEDLIGLLEMSGRIDPPGDGSSGSNRAAR